MLWTTDEEVGSGTSAAIEDEARRSRAVLVLEPSLPGGAVNRARKGCGSYQVTVRGVAAHAGIEPQKGASAVQQLLAHQILRINALQNIGARDLGQHHAGVRRTAIQRRSRTKPGATVDVRVPSCRRGCGARRRVPRPARRSTIAPGSPLRAAWTGRRWNGPAASRVCMKRRGAWPGSSGAKLAEGGTGGGSDGNFTAALGVPTLDGLGAGRRRRACASRTRPRSARWRIRAALVAGLYQR